MKKEIYFFLLADDFPSLCVYTLLVSMSLNDGAKKTTAITQLSSYLFISFLHYYLLLLNTTLTANAILQTQKGLIPSKSQIPCVQGQFINNRCVCPPGWTGPFCEHCFGRVRYNSTTHNFSDGKRNYTASSRCTWIIEDDVANTTTPVPLLLDISHFMTECCWDHFYVYDGDSVNNNLIAVLRRVTNKICIIFKNFLILVDDNHPGR